MKVKTNKLPRILAGMHAVTGGDTRSIINHVLVKDNLAIATDGYILAVRPVHSMDGVTALIPAEVAKKTAKATWLEIVPGDNGMVTVRDGSTVYACPSSGHNPDFYPKWQQFIPKTDRQLTEIRINAVYLKRLADAITTDGILTLHIPEEEYSVIRVDGDEGYGAIMPVRK